MTLKLLEPCVHCDGSGMIYNPEPSAPEESPCRRCDGTGTSLTDDGRAIAALIHRVEAAT